MCPESINLSKVIHQVIKTSGNIVFAWIILRVWSRYVGHIKNLLKSYWSFKFEPNPQQTLLFYFDLVPVNILSYWQFRTLIFSSSILISDNITSRFCKFWIVLRNFGLEINQFQPSVTFHIETSHLICFANSL